MHLWCAVAVSNLGVMCRKAGRWMTRKVTVGRRRRPPTDDENDDIDDDDDDIGVQLERLKKRILRKNDAKPTVCLTAAALSLCPLEECKIL